jgi:hypothetical protein
MAMGPHPSSQDAEFPTLTSANPDNDSKPTARYLLYYIYPTLWASIDIDLFPYPLSHVGFVLDMSPMVHLYPTQCEIAASERSLSSEPSLSECPKSFGSHRSRMACPKVHIRTRVSQVTPPSELIEMAQ